jgi:hypothetical protein
LQGVHKDLEERRFAGSARHGKKVGLGDLLPVPPISLAARNRSFRYVTKKLWNQEHMYSHLCLCYSTSDPGGRDYQSPFTRSSLLFLIFFSFLFQLS